MSHKQQNVNLADLKWIQHKALAHIWNPITEATLCGRVRIKTGVVITELSQRARCGSCEYVLKGIKQ